MQVDLKRVVFGEMPEHTEGRLERVGRWILIPAKDLPKAVLEKIGTPQGMVAVATLTASVADSLLFYPERTWDWITWTWDHVVDWIGFEEVRFVGYAATMLYIVGTGVRAQGRLMNPQLMEKLRG